MKIQRLLAIVTFLLNREIVSASELAVKYKVSVRTIQRDIDTLCAAGIPIVSAPGSKGGYGIIEGYRLDRQMIDIQDLFFMITSLESIKTSYKKSDLDSTLEKVKSLANSYQNEKMEDLKEKLFIDFSSLSIDRSGENNFYIIEQSVNNQKTIKFTYGSPQGKYSIREVEPLTVVFKWFSWYLYAYCLEKKDYRLFKISRIQNLEATGVKFQRRGQSFLDYQKKTENMEFNNDQPETVVLKFQPVVKVLVTDYFRNHKIQENSDGTIIVDFFVPVSDWVIGLILSYGSTVEVISPQKIRQMVVKSLQDSLAVYK